jgi:hypothetical protein
MRKCQTIRHERVTLKRLELRQLQADVWIWREAISFDETDCLSLGVLRAVNAYIDL